MQHWGSSMKRGSSQQPDKLWSIWYLWEHFQELQIYLTGKFHFWRANNSRSDASTLIATYRKRTWATRDPREANPLCPFAVVSHFLQRSDSGRSPRWRWFAMITRSPGVDWRGTASPGSHSRLSGGNNLCSEVIQHCGVDPLRFVFTTRNRGPDSCQRYMRGLMSSHRPKTNYFISPSKQTLLGRDSSPFNVQIQEGKSSKTEQKAHL